MKKVLFSLIIGSLVFAMQDFPISAFHVNDTTWFQGAGADSLGLNLIWVDSDRNENIMLAKLNAAYNKGLKVQLWNAVKGIQSGPNWNHNETEWYGRRFWTNWEVDGSNFNQSIGELVTDPAAQDSDAWKATVGIDNPGMMINGPERSTDTRSAQVFDFHFLLKIDNLGDDSVKVCSLWIKNKTSLLRDSIITVGDFDSAGVYKDIFISFYSSRPYLHYGIYWYGNRTLWADYIETKDRFVEDVLRGEYYDSLVNIIEIYSDHPALEQFYLLDEPDVGRFVLPFQLEMGCQLV